MRVYIDISNSVQSFGGEQKGAKLLKFLSLYAEGSYVLFSHEVVKRSTFGPMKPIEVEETGIGGGTDLNCFGDELSYGNELKLLLTDGAHPPFNRPTRNVITINPDAGGYKPKNFALQLSLLDGILQSNISFSQTAYLG